MPKKSRSNSRRNSRNTRVDSNSHSNDLVSSEEAIRAGEQIAMAAFSSGLKLAAAFGTVAAKTAGLALASLASGADKFSELVKEEALRSYNGANPLLVNTTPKKSKKRASRKTRES